MLCYPLVVATAFRTIGAVWLFHLMSLEGKFRTPWMDGYQNLTLGWSPISIPSNSSWLWLFNAYDSLHFQLIAVLGYYHPNYVYLPWFPVLIRLAGLLTGDYWFGGFLVTQLFAIGSIVMFQFLAELYMKPREAMYATLLMATFPYISVFTTLSYSEAIFIFSSLSTWYFYKTERIEVSSLFAGLASVTRIYGFVIVLPMLLSMVSSKHYRRLFYLLIPTAFIGLWALYCYFSTGDPIVSWTDEKYWIFDSKFSLAQIILIQGLKGVGCCAVHPGILVSVGLFAIVIARTWRVDRFLWTYAVSLFSLLLFTTVDHLSLLRYFPFIFPLWLTVKLQNPLIVAVCVAFFVPVSLILWLYALSAIFIG